MKPVSGQHVPLSAVSAGRCLKGLFLYILRFDRMAHHTFSVFFTLILLLGCGSGPDKLHTTIEDDLGREVTIPSQVERVVSLAPNLTELVYAAGGGSSLVAITSSGDYPPAVDSLPHVSALPVDFEGVTSYEPDLIVATDQINAPGDIETFEALGLPIYFFSFGSLTDIVNAVTTMGRLLGTEGAAADSAAALQRQIDALRARTRTVPAGERPRVLVLVGDDTLYSFGKGSYVHTLVELAGGHSITAEIETQAPTLNDEYVLTHKPDVIVGTWGTDYDRDRLLELHPTWDVVPAVKNERVYSLPPELISRPSPRVVAGARRLAQLLHPDRVQPSADRPDSLDRPSRTPEPTP